MIAVKSVSTKKKKNHEIMEVIELSRNNPKVNNYGYGGITDWNVIIEKKNSMGTIHRR